MRGGDFLGDEGLIEMIERTHDMRGTVFLEALVWTLAAFAGDEDFPDDLSAVLFEYSGPDRLTLPRADAAPLAASTRRRKSASAGSDSTSAAIAAGRNSAEWPGSVGGPRRAHRPRQIDVADLLGPAVVFRHVGEPPPGAEPARGRDRPAGLLVDLAVQRGDRLFARVDAAAGQLVLGLRLGLKGQQASDRRAIRTA